MTVFSGSQGLHLYLPIGIFLDKLQNDTPPLQPGDYPKNPWLKRYPLVN
jgi:hypothetical protein